MEFQYYIFFLNVQYIDNLNIYYYYNQLDISNDENNNQFSVQM